MCNDHKGNAESIQNRSNMREKEKYDSLKSYVQSNLKDSVRQSLYECDLSIKMKRREANSPLT